MVKDTLTHKQAEKVLLVRKGMVHTFFNPSFGLIGGDHSLKSILNDLKNAFEIRLCGEQALGMGHGISIIPSKECYQKDILFIETTPEFNKKQLKRLRPKEVHNR